MKKTPQDKINQVLVLKSLGFSSRKIAKLVLGSASKKSTVNDILSRHSGQVPADHTSDEQHPNVLLLDIETSFQVFGGFGRFNQNFSESQVFENTKLLGTCAKWLGSPDMMEIWPVNFQHWSTPEEQRGMLQLIWNLLDRADYLIAHNAQFDVKSINTFFVTRGFPKPSPFRIIDTLRIARQNFRFDSNKLDSLGKFLNIGRKVPHGGFELWRRCVSGDSDAFRTMIEYCHQDVLLLEEVYMALRAWDSRHPNFSIHYDDRHRCGICCSEDLEDTGRLAYTNTQVYPLFRCNNCGGWHRLRKSEKSDSKTLVGVK